MATAFTMLFAKIAAVVEWFGKLAVAIFTALWDVVCDAWCWPFEQFMKIVVAAVGAFDTSALSNSLQGWGSIPADVLNILGLIGVGQALAIISAAIGIRFALQLIPFTRLGS